MSGARLVVDGLRVGGHDLSFVADGGTSVALLGTPGDDSSMLLETVAGLRPSRDGVVLLGGGPVGPPRVGIMQRPTGLFQELTAAENVAVPLLAQHRPADPDLIDRTLASLDLAPASRHNLVEQLSGGQQQRVAIARALVSSAPLLCLDEPVSELDEASIETVWTALTGALSAGAILVIATVDAELAARCDQLVPLGTSTGPAA